MKEGELRKQGTQIPTQFMIQRSKRLMITLSPMVILLI